MPRLDIIEADASPDDVRKAALENFKTTQQSLDLLGSQLLVEKSSMMDVTTTTVAYALVKAFQTAFQSSGGLIMVQARLNISVPANTSTAFRLVVDGKEVDSTPVYDQAGVFSGPITLSAYLNLTSGGHTAQVEARTAAGTLYVNLSGYLSKLSVVEFLKGG